MEESTLTHESAPALNPDSPGAALTLPDLAPAEPRRILLVEDDDADAARLGAALTRAWSQLELVRSNSIEQAEALLRAEIECVLLDMDLLETVGAAGVRHLRRCDAEVPIVVLVDEHQDDLGLMALAAGAQDYLVKGHDDGLGMARAIRHAVQRGRAERLWRELALLRLQSAETARTQRGLIPHLLLDDPRIATRTGYRPGNRRQVLGGDFFDAIQSSPRRLQVVLGDVCGHGPDEAALGIHLRIAWRTLILAGVEQEPMLVTLDRLAARERHAEHVYATVATVDVDLDAGVANVALAGHPPPLVSTGGDVRLLTEHAGGPPLGMNLPPRWELHRAELGDDWRMLLYSDGLYEGYLRDHSSRLGIEGLVKLLAAAGPESIWTSVPDELLNRVEDLNGGPLEDDVALLALRFTGR